MPRYMATGYTAFYISVTWVPCADVCALCPYSFIHTRNEIFDKSEFVNVIISNIMTVVFVDIDSISRPHLSRHFIDIKSRYAV